MSKGRARFAALLAGVAAPIYFLIQLLLGAEAGDAAIRAILFFLLLFLVSLAINWEKRAAPKRNEVPPEPSGPPE
jgi:hypothetical protein